MKLAECIDDFIRFSRTERGLAENSVKAYESDLIIMWRYLTQSGAEALTIKAVTPLHLKDFVAHLRDDGQFKPRSLGRVMSSLRRFFDYARRKEWIEKSPAEGLRNPKVPKRLPVYLVDDEASRLLKAPDRSDPEGFRNYAVLVTFLFTGLRLSELVGLNVEDLNFSGNTLLVRGKGSKERLLPLHQKVTGVLQAYLEGPRPFTTLSPAPLFLTDDGRRLTPRMVGYAVEKSVAAAGLSHRITPHKLRHTFATQLLHRGASLLEIKELLGHSQLATTSIYTHTNVERLRTAVKKIDG